MENYYYYYYYIGILDITLLSLLLESDYKNLFLRKKSSQPGAALDLARVEKGEVIPDNTAPKNYLLFLSRTTIGTLSTNSGTKLKTGKNSLQRDFVIRFLNSRLSISNCKGKKLPKN